LPTIGPIVDGLVSPPLELVFDLTRLGSQPLRDRDALELEAFLPGLSVDVRKAHVVLTSHQDGDLGPLSVKEVVVIKRVRLRVGSWPGANGTR
jgi:hypothetical protein